MVIIMKKTKSIGLDATPPEETCESKFCPWHGTLKVRGRIFKGKVVSSKPANTAVVKWNYFIHSQKYNRGLRKKTKVSAQNPACISAKQNDIVRIAECRPISKTKKFVIFEKL
jgi:small subunit ribosomal protein S17